MADEKEFRYDPEAEKKLKEIQIAFCAVQG